jgi:predicted dehydrogenase
MSRLKIGIIGTGGISHSHVRGYKGNDDLAEIVAVADINEDRAREAAEEWGVPKHCTDYRQILDMPDVDAVSVCTYNMAHRDPTVDALNAGKHVLCEKPMAATLDDAIAMTKAARQTDKNLMIAFHSRYGTSQIAAKRIMQSGDLGKIYYGETTTCRRRGAGGGTFERQETAGVGVIADIGCYSLDTALDLLGHPKPVRVSGTTALVICPNPDSKVDGSWGHDPERIDVEEFGAAWVRFDNGMVLVFKASWAIHGNSLGRPFFLGETGGLALNPLEVFTDKWGTMVDIKPVNIPAEDDRFVLETRAFLESVRDGKPSPIPPDEIIIQNAIIDAIVRSAKEGREVDVTPWEDKIG